MESALEIWNRRREERWIAGVDASSFRADVERAMHGVRDDMFEVPTAEPVKVVAQFLAAMARGHDVRIATGGTTHAPRHAVHTWGTLGAAAFGLQEFLGGGPIDSVCFLPLYHVSGLMQVVRSFATDGMLTLADWNGISAGRFPEAAHSRVVTSLVPTQLVRLFDVPGAMAWLRGFRAVFLGGAAAWPELLERARREHVPLALCYGMTETAAQVTTLHPAAFLAGRNDVGRALPHAQVEIVDEKSDELLPSRVEGRIRVRGASLFCGYHPENRSPVASFLTGDRGVLSASGHLTVSGRIDALINTGGEKVDPGEVEAAIRATGMVTDVAVVGVPDREWGEAVAAVVEAQNGIDVEVMRALLKKSLASFKVPKRIVCVARLPRNEAGKLDRAAIRAIVESENHATFEN